MHRPLAQNLAANVKAAMEKRGWTQRQLAAAAQLSQAGVGYVLRYRDVNDRHATLDTVEKLAKALGFEPLALLRPQAGSSAQNVQSITPRLAKRHPHERDEETQSKSLDPDLLEFIAEQAQLHLKRGTAKERAALIRRLYEAYSDGSEKPSKASVLRLVRSA